MPTAIRITEADLRSFMRDSRYWQSGHPERETYVGWVTDGFRALYGTSEGTNSGAVWVKPYSRTRDGHVEQVSGHWRTAPASGGAVIEAQDRGSVPPNYGQRVPGPQDPVGRSGNPVEVRPGTNPPGDIAGRPYSGHAFDRMQGRGVPPTAVEHAVRPETFVGINNGVHLYWDPASRVMVVVDPRTNSVITAYARATRPTANGRTP